MITYGFEQRCYWFLTWETSTGLVLIKAIFFFNNSGVKAGSHIVSIASVTSKTFCCDRAIIHNENITQTIANVCGDWEDRNSLYRPCSILLASLSFLRHKTASGDRDEPPIASNRFDRKRSGRLFENKAEWYFCFTIWININFSLLKLMAYVCIGYCMLHISRYPTILRDYFLDKTSLAYHRFRIRVILNTYGFKPIWILSNPCGFWKS